MARLDQLIGALVKHSADSLVLSQDQKPALIIAGTPRPIVKSALDIDQVRQLVAEVTPDEQRSSVLVGLATSFVYDGGAAPVMVEVQEGEVVIRLHQVQAPPPPAPTPAAAAPEPPPLPVPSPVPVADEQAAVPIAGPAPVADEQAAVPISSPAAVAVAVPTATDGPLDMDRLLRLLVETGGSDLHLSSECRPMLRVDGHLEDLASMPELDAASAEKLLLAIAPERNRNEFAERGDTDFGYTIEGLARFRCNLFRDRKGAGGVFRVIPTDILSAETLGLSAAIQNFAHLTKGLVLVTGPTGSGKSTTLAAMVDLVNLTRPDHVITIEDPIEFVHPNKKCLINQREVQIHTASFKSALRAALREDPDVVLVGELRDLETVAIALETAETGHLVFGTLHTNSAVSTVDRIIDQFPGDEQARIRIMLSESLKGIVAQVLCRKIGGGRIAAHEVLVVNAAVSNLIREGKSFQIPSIMQTGRSIGMLTMNGALLELVRSKRVEPQEAYSKAVDKQGLLASFRNKNISVDFATGDKPNPQPA